MPVFASSPRISVSSRGIPSFLSTEYEFLCSSKGHMGSQRPGKLEFVGAKENLKEFWD